MLIEAMKKFWDAVQVNLPVGGAIAIVSLTELETIVKIGAVTVGTVCTIVVTFHKIKQKERDQ